MEMSREDLMALTDNLEQKILSVEDMTWEDIQTAMSCITEERDKGLYGLVCYYAAFYMISNGRLDECLCYLNESIRCLRGTAQECEICRCYNMSGVVAHSQNNLVLAMEHYEKACIYARQYNQQVIYCLAVGNMADTYYRVGSYDHAITCYQECIDEMKRVGRSSFNSKSMYLKILSSYGYCLIMTDKVSEAISVAEELKILAREDVYSAVEMLAVYSFLALLAYRSDDSKKADEYTQKAVDMVMQGCTISTDFDNILNLIHYLILVKQFERLKQVLDCLEPQAAIERNEGFLLQLLLFRLQYCSEDMDQKSFLESTQTFFKLKNKYECAENNQVLRITSLRNKLRKIEEEQTKLMEKNTKLIYQTEHDEVSGLYNKRYLNRHMEEIFEEAMQKKLPLGVLFLDIDYFKQMNDAYGHQKGDSCIAVIAEVIRKCMPEDFAARYGGDEFVIITIGRTKEYLQQRAQMLVDEVKARQIPNIDSKYAKIVTITIGAVCAIPQKPNKMWDFLSAADKMLYQQKNEQKGCARFYIGQGENL